jgi:hypothetical protein
MELATQKGFSEVARFAWLNGYRLVAANHSRQVKGWGGQYSLVRRKGESFVYANDDLEQVRGWIAARG